jgi:hypothetical protein
MCFARTAAFSQITALALTKKLKETTPVIVHDSYEAMVVVGQIEKAGAKFVAFKGLDEKIAFAVADAIEQHAKTGRGQIGFCGCRPSVFWSDHVPIT